VTLLGCRASAIAEGVAALDRVHVEHGGPHRERAPVTEPEFGADPRADGEVGVAGGKAIELTAGEVADEDGAGGQAGGDDVVDQPGDLAEVAGDVEGEVHRDPGQPAGVRALVHTEGLVCLRELAPTHAVATHRRELLEHVPGLRIAAGEVTDVGQPADGVDHPPTQRRRHLERRA